MEDKDKLVLTQRYHRAMGLFNGAWSAFDLLTDYAIYRFLGVTAHQAHLITSGMMFGRKARLLADLIGRSDHPNKAAILGAFNKARGNNKRDVFAHSMIWSDKHDVTFVERTVSNEFRAIEHKFTMEELEAHVLEFVLASQAFWDALGAKDKDIQDFGNAALSLNRKPSKSPGKPTSKK